MKTISIRAHHLLCTVLYQGKGYSEEFTDNMTKVVGDLLIPDAEVILQNMPDLICSSCPNLCGDGKCALDLDKKKTRVGDINSLDSYIAEFFHFPFGQSMSSKKIFSHIDKNITEEFFESCCHNCRWYKLGLCSYDSYKDNIKKFL